MKTDSIPVEVWRLFSFEDITMTDELSGRNDDGTFAQGNTFSDGRNKYARQQELRELFTAAVTESEIQRLANDL